MFLGAAIDLGVSVKEIESLLSGLNLTGWRFSTRKAARHSLVGTQLAVEIDEQLAPTSHRSLAKIRAIIEQASSLPPRARARALAIFQVIGEAEAKIHEIPIPEVHFHEVGAIDSIVDVCGATAVLELLGDPQVYAAPPPLGSGANRAAHGTIPIPAPATLEILRDLPVRFEGVGELTTPTGAALLKVLCKISPPPEFLLQRVGYGVGSNDFPDRPNVLRASIGRTQEGLEPGTWVAEANLDDCSPQLLGSLLEQLLESGAYDAFILPATMKKGRPGHLVGAVVPADRKHLIVDLLLSESTTLGVRLHRVERIALERRYQEVETSYGRVRIKLAERNGSVINAQPEFEDCRALALQHRVPVKLVQAEALAVYYASSLKRG
jgi:uncharacterized protein (TIGR00299 family) protein